MRMNMLRVGQKTCRLLAVALFLSVPGIAAAQTAPAAKLQPSIAVVDVETVMKGSTAAKSVRDQVDHYQGGFRDEIAKEEEKLRKREQELRALEKQILDLRGQVQSGKLTQAQMTQKVQAHDKKLQEYEKKKQGFDKEVNAFRMRADAIGRALDQSYSAAMEKVTKAMVDVVRDVATARGDNIVMPRTQVMLYDESMNISTLVLDALNKKLPNVTVDKPKVETPAAPASQPQRGAQQGQGAKR